MYNTVIVGGGVAGLSAALYLARAGKKVVIFERGEIGGELSRIDHIENYPGYTGSGQNLASAMRVQAKAAGAEIKYGECTKIVRSRDGIFTLTIDKTDKITAETVIAATGSEPRKLDFDITPPVSYCALCDGVLAKGKRVAIVGGANSAFQGALYLASLAASVTIISRSEIKADTYLRRKICELENVEVRENLQPTAELLANYDYVFVFIGTKPATAWLGSLDEQVLIDKSNKLFSLEVSKEYRLLDDDGYIITGGRKRTAHATDVPGLYAAGDVRAGMTKQVVTAAGDGADAAIEIIAYLK